MNDATETFENLPPAPSSNGRSKEARRRRAEAAAALETGIETGPAPNDVRARPTRAESTRRERRRRDGVDKTSNLKLGFRFTPDPGYEYRWINDGIDGQRLKDKTVDDDWEVVSVDGEPTDAAGSGLRRAVGETKSGPIYSYLCRKPKDWYEADHRKGQDRLDRMMKHIRQGQAPSDISRSLRTTDNVYGAEDIRITGPGGS